MSVVEQSRPVNAAVETPDDIVVVYMVGTRRYRPALFLPPESIEICLRGKRDQIRGVIRRMMLHRNRLIRWIGRVFRAGHRFYQKLEDRIDPLERMLKALNGPSTLRVLYGSSRQARDDFRDMLRGQVVRHMAWVVTDAALTVVAVAFSPFLVPIPGPNVILYYPALRVVSHYRAMSGARKALNDSELVFEAREELEQLERRLRAGATPGAGCAGAQVRVPGLESFLEKMI